MPKAWVINCNHNEATPKAIATELLERPYPFVGFPQVQNDVIWLSVVSFVSEEDCCRLTQMAVSMIAEMRAEGLDDWKICEQLKEVKVATK